MSAEIKLAKSSLFLSAFLWGFGFVAVEGALISGWDPMALLAARGFIGGSLLLIFSYRRKFWKNKELMIEGIKAGFFLTLGFVGQTYGQALSGPANASFITAMYVIFVPIIGALWYKHKITPIVVLTSITAFIGVALISVQGSIRINIGDIWLLGGAIFFAVHIIRLSQLSRFNDSLSLTTIQLFTMSAISSTFLLFTDTNFTSSGLYYVLYIGLISSGIAFFLQTFGQKSVASSVASIILTFEAIFGVLGSAIVFKLVIPTQTWIGGIMLLGSVFFLEALPLIVKKKS
ncbi:MAG: DMT family transporter [Erysipelothrix sp.]|jgi:drug/metabolite transporter (DMT)-like permease|nr:DMT family transporter [Erysipelothrix sp.]